MKDSGGDRRPGLVVISNSVTPYRLNLHRLIVAGIPELQLHSLITHGISDFDWALDIPANINAKDFSDPGDHPLDNPLRHPWREWRKSRRLISYLKECRAAAVVINGYRYIPYLQAMSYCYRRQIPFFVRNDSNIRCEPVHSWSSAATKRALYGWWTKRAAGVFSMGELGDELFVKYGADPHRLYRVPYWPDYDSYASVDSDALARFKQRFGLNDQRRYLVYSGRLAPEKRVDLLIDAFAAIAPDRPNWDLLVVGDGALREELRGRVPPGLHDRVIWTGFLDRNEPALAYHCGEILVLPSAAEPWALVVQEAMAAGLAVVASDVVGAAHELIRDDFGGRIFKSGDGKHLEQALREVTDPGQTYSVKQEAQTALREYRRRVDPVAEIRRALCDVGVLNTNSTTVTCTM